MTEWHVYECYPDSRPGARDLLDDLSDLQGIDEARFTPDPSIPGCWLVETGEWKALVYLGNHPLAPDFEVVE